MHKDLQKVIDSLGNNPLEEKELNELIQDKDIFEIVQDIWTQKCSDLNQEDYEDEDLETFFKDLETKVFSLFDKDGIVKTTEKTENIKPLKYMDSAKVKTKQKQIQKQMEKLQKIRENIDGIEESEKVQEAINDIKKIGKARETLDKELSILLLKGIDTSELTKWEKNLAIETRAMLIHNPAKTKQGKIGKS